MDFSSKEPNASLGDIPPEETDLNYASVFVRFTNQVIRKCTSDREFDERILIRLDALKNVYQANLTSVVAINLRTLDANTMFSSEHGRRPLNDSLAYSLKEFVQEQSLQKLEEDKINYFIRNEKGVYRLDPSKRAGEREQLLICYPLIKTSNTLWLLNVVNPRRFSEYTLSTSLAGDAIKTEISKRLMLEEIAGGNTPFLQTELPETGIFVKMLGMFQLTSRQGTIDCNSIGGHQCTLLLANMLLHQQRRISTQEIAEILLGNSLANNPRSSVKSAIFRIRKALDPVLSEGLILSQNNSYFINPDYEIILDVSQFELFCNMAKKKNISDIERLALLEYAIKMYSGNLLPGLETEISLMGHATYYLLLFDNALEEYLKILAQNNKFERIFRTIAHLSTQQKANPEVHLILIKSLIAMNRRDLALAHYRKLERHLSQEMLDVMREHLAKAEPPPMEALTFSA